MATRLAFVAGEASGDLLCAGVIQELGRRQTGIECGGIGGDRMIAAGFDAWEHVRALSLRGYVEVIRHLPRLLELRSSLHARLVADPPAAFVGVDAPDFNLALESRLRAAGIPTVHYISPSIWAWRPERIEQIRRAVDHMLLVFPFEQEIYNRAGIPATYVGHPLASMIPLVPDAGAARHRLGLSAAGVLLAVLPGSRPDEIRHNGPQFVGAMAELQKREPGLRFAVPAADPALRLMLTQQLCRYPGLMAAVDVLDGHSHDCLEAADAALVASGTATLEAALFKRPMVIAYRSTPLSAWLIRRKGVIRWCGLPNILAGETLVPELVQEEVTPSRLADAVIGQLNNAAGRAELVERFTRMHHELRRDTAQLAADIILSVAAR